MHPGLSNGQLPAYAVKIQGTIDVWISFPKTFSFETVSTELRARNFDINATTYKNYRIIGLRVAAQRLNELASLPMIEYVQPAPGEDQLLNNKSTVNARANVISSSLGRHLTGQGVVIGIGDNADPYGHIDNIGRIINRNSTNGGNHGLHVMATAAGAGILNEKFAGYAPKATVLAQFNSGILNSLPAYVQDYGMVITNNSYGLIGTECESFGIYDLYSRILDQQAADLPHLQNVFAAGNSGLFGTINCTRYPNGFGTVFSSYQSAKNVISVGNTTENDSLHYVSSRGPVRDGRIKPDIAAQGRIVWSAGFGSYWANTGTSMASPAVAGGLALLYQYYRQLNSNADPKNGLMKALLCNGATDLGNTGPDYSYGFGWMNLLRSAIMLENNDYFINTIATGNTNNQVLTIPANTAQLKVMLYWNDTAASVLAGHTLVNDLDLEIVDPSSTIHLPFILDTLPANVENPAVTGVDHINNIEQVVILNPPAGNYTLRVKGTAINQNPVQEYFLVFDTIPVSTTLTYPIGKEKLFPGDSIYISWDSWGGPANTFNLEYSKNNGASWIPINSNVAAGLRQYKWFAPPGDTTDQAKIRITRNATAMVSTSEAFTILGEDTIRILPVQFQCEGYIRVNWTSVNDATDYEVMILRGDEMVPVATTTDTIYTFSGLSKDSVYWVSVRPRVNGNPGRRAIALFRQPNNGGCLGTISDNDLTVESILSPVSSGRLLTATALSNSIPVTIRIKNLDDVSSTADIAVSYSVNGGTPVTAVIDGTTIPTSTIAAGGSIDYTFTTNVDLSAVGTYSIQVTATKTGDPVSSNNSQTKVYKQLANPAIAIGDLPWLDNFETAPSQSVNTDQMGLDGRDRYDFVNNTQYGRIRTFLNTGIAYSGTQALTLDVERFFGGTNVDSLTGTFNLATFDTASDDIRLDFRYKNHGQAANGANKVWIRGNDGSNWIPVYDLYANQNPADGSYKLSSSIEVSDSLIARSQNFTTSFQVRWGQYGQFMAADNEARAGYTFDDIQLYRVTNDIQMIRIDTPVSVSCALSNAVPVKVTVRNTANSTINNIPVVLRVDGTIIATENIPTIAGNTTIQYTFSPATADLSAVGTHTVEVWVQLATDTYRPNDTAMVMVTNSPVMTGFPYLENFEAGTGFWYASGKNNSWEYGTPAAIKMRRAASGSKAWKTGIAGFYNDNELSYLYSPCFDVSGMTNPTLSLSLALDIEDCGPGLCDAAWVEYSADGVIWTKLGAFGQGTNWYNKNYGGNQLWSTQDYTRWHVATTALPSTNNNRLRLRFVFNSDPGLTKEGIGVDDIHIYDNINGIYDGATMGAPVTQTISGGTSWIDFMSGGKLVTSVQPNNQAMGSTDVQAYIYTGAVRNHSGQYYHNRNITIKPATTALSDSAIVRFYFLDTETEALIAATGCSGCTKPSMAYELGVSKYSDPNDAVEDGDVTNSLGSYWSFINAANAVKVPFDKGYYAEFKVRDFSEFWLNNGGFDNSHPLPVQLISFTAVKTANRKDVLAFWKTASEFNVDRFEIEVARGSDEFRQNRFVKIGEVDSRGNATTDQQYSFVDIENNKSGVRYYRLKIVDVDGSFSYSAIRPVVFTEEMNWQVYPNPSAGIFNLIYQLNIGDKMKVKVYDAGGRTVYESTHIGSGFMQKINIDMSAAVFTSGLYLIEAEGSDTKQSFKVFKN
jgi:Subtilase family/Secretion system C-terminal sorting domain